MKVFVRVATATVVWLALGAASRSAELHQGRCHMDSCYWFSIEETDLVASNAAGALFRTASRSWQSHHPNGSYERRTPRKGGQVSTEYVFCSKSRPALIVSYDGKWLVDALTPDREDGIFGANYSSYKSYFVVCHQTRIVDPYRENAKLARRYGYKTQWSEAEHSK